MATTPRPPTIAVFDSGIGGLTILASLVKRIPAANFVYYGDTVHAPYGQRSPEEIFALSVAAVEKLLTSQPEVIVIACNTVTSTSIAKLREKFPAVQFVGVEPAVKPAVVVTTTKKIIVVATQATLQSHAYRQLKTDWTAGVEIIDLPKPAWVKMVEANTVKEEILQADADTIQKTGADVLVLACTHFPFLKNKLQALLPQMMMIDSAEPVANRVWRVLGEPTDVTSKIPNITWIFTDPQYPNEAVRERLWTIAQQIR